MSAIPPGPDTGLLLAELRLDKMIEGRGNLVLPLRRRVFLVVFAGIGCLFLSARIFADESALPPDHGFMLIRLNLSIRERVDLLAMSNTDKEHVINIRGGSFQPAGVNAWMALVPMPSGRYFWSEYQPAYGITTSEVQRLPARYKRNKPGSDGESFEIIAEAVNYVGDWTMRIDSSHRVQLNPIIKFNKSTLERYVTQYPENSNRYEIYLSAMGQDAKSLDELAKSTQ